MGWFELQAWLAELNQMRREEKEGASGDPESWEGQSDEYWDNIRGQGELAN